METCRLIWTLLVSTYLVNSRTIPHQITPQPNAALTQYSVNNTKVKETSPVNGFTYEVRFPPKIPSSINKSNYQLDSRLTADSVQYESIQNINLEDINHDSGNILTSAYSNPTVFQGAQTQESDSYVSSDKLDSPSCSESTGYSYERPIDELKLPGEENTLPDSHEKYPSYMFMDINGIFDKESLEVLSAKNGKRVEESSSMDSDLKLPLGQASQRLSDVIEPETYSLVKFTGSVFTPEGLPALGSEEDFPVNYKFSYVIRGQPSLGHEEARIGNQSSGMYWVHLPDGRIQEVRYTVSDEEGYQPIITYRTADSILALEET